jgi:hypothetical protein
MNFSFDANKKASPLWFYFFSLFFSVVGIATCLTADMPLVARIPLGLLFLAAGISFLMEPLNRKNLLPRTIAEKYEVVTSRFGKTSSSRRATLIVQVLSATVLLIFFCSDAAFGPMWSTVRIFLVGLIGFYAFFFLVIGIFQMLHDWGPGRIRQSKFIASTVALLQPDVQMGSLNTLRSMVHLGFYFVLLVVGFYATLSLREGSVFGPLALAVMVIMSFGQSLVYGREAKARATVEAELKTAHDMQMGLMPREDPKIKGFDISGTCVPAREVGGDYFDYVWLDRKKSKVGIAIADVSGKAMKAAITAVMTSGMIYREIENNDTPRSILKNINRPMYLKTDRQVFTAMSFSVIDIKKKTLTFSNAGQSQPILLRDSHLTYIKVKGARLPLGVMAEQDYKEATLKLKSGDILLFYTDGLPEATDADHQLLGFEAMEQELVRCQSSSAGEIVSRMTELVNRHTGKTEQHDDMTVVVVRVL